MKIKSKLFILLITLLTIYSFTYTDNWFLFKSEEFGYQIEFPKEPVSMTKEVNSEIGFIKMNLNILDLSKDSNDDNLIYMVNHSIYPDSIIHSSRLELLDDFFKKSINGIVNGVHGKLISEQKIEIEDYPGREIKVDFKNGLAIIQIRMILVQNKMYLIQTITKTEKDFNNSKSRFMDSFKLIQIKKN